MFERKQNVRFNSNVDVFSFLNTPVASDMTDEEKRSTWYSKDELRTLRGNAREASRLIRQIDEESISLHVPQHYFISEYDACIRGLELRSNLERKKNQCITRRVIMKYQHRLRLGLTRTSAVFADPELHLAIISKKLSQRARDIALSTARKDYIAAYPEMEMLVSVFMDPVHIADFPCRKRKINASIHDQPDQPSNLGCGMERRVKRRIFTRMEQCEINNASMQVALS
mmetsp:Transcript_31724/g.42275  ORF Transcript_31724/g.42275 Transcript_31724/m.42275 type:complete len:228 (+) Transcript_31724:37-720(+)